MESDQVERMRALVEQARARRDELLAREFTARSDDGYVSVTVDGGGKLTGLTLNPRVFRNPDSEGLAAQIVAQYDAATEQVREAWDGSGTGEVTSGPAEQRAAGRRLYEAVLDAEGRGEPIR